MKGYSLRILMFPLCLLLQRFHPIHLPSADGTGDEFLRWIDEFEQFSRCISVDVTQCLWVPSPALPKYAKRPTLIYISWRDYSSKHKAVSASSNGRRNEEVISVDENNELLLHEPATAPEMCCVWRYRWCFGLVLFAE